MTLRKVCSGSVLFAACALLTSCGKLTSAQTVPTTQVPVTTTTEPQVIVASGQRSGASTQAAQRKLLSLGFWLESDSRKVRRNQRAKQLWHFRSITDCGQREALTAATAYLLDEMTFRVQAKATEGTLAEVDKERSTAVSC